MDKALRPERLDIDPLSPAAAKQWKHWIFTFENYMQSLNFPEEDKFQLLANFIGPDIFEYVADCKQYKGAIEILTSVFIKPKNIIYARHLLCTCKQESGQSLDQFLQKLKLLAKDCEFKAVSADQYLNESVRDAFIRGLTSAHIRQRLLENDSPDLEKVFSQARSLESAEIQSNSYSSREYFTDTCAVQPMIKPESPKPICDSNVCALTLKCFFCGYNKHPRSKCPAREATCKTCNKIGHFQRVRRSSTSNKHIASSTTPSISTIVTASVPSSLSRAMVKITINGISCDALIDTGSSDSYICTKIVHAHGWKVHPSYTTITLASTNHSSKTEGHCFVNLIFKNSSYNDVKLSLLPNLCSDVLLGHDF